MRREWYAFEILCHAAGEAPRGLVIAGGVSLPAAAQLAENYADYYTRELGYTVSAYTHFIQECRACDGTGRSLRRRGVRCGKCKGDHTLRAAV